jgi:opacity protein-like surface antigen
MKQGFLTSTARFCYSIGLLLGLGVFTHPALAQNQEVTLSLGGVFSQSRSFQPTGAAQTSGDFDLEANYGYRFFRAKPVALYGELEFVALPNRSVTTATAIVPKNYASLFVAPGLRLKFAPSARLSPWVAIGGGYALFQQSTEFSNGQNTTDKFLNRGVFDFGGGVDYTLFRFLGLRAEVRDLVSGNPNLNVALSSGTQHNIISSGGIIVRF